MNAPGREQSREGAVVTMNDEGSLSSLRGDLFSGDPHERLSVAMEWARRDPAEAVPTEAGLPVELRTRAATLEAGTFGGANAWLLLVGPSPGGSPPVDAAATARAIELDSFPVVLGRAHPHFYWPDTAGFFAKTRLWATEGFGRAGITSSEEDALSLSMIVNLLDRPASDSRALRAQLHGGYSRLRSAISFARPRLVVALTSDVYDASLAAFPEASLSGVETVQVRQYKPFFRWVDDGISPFLLARAPNHPSRHHPVPETYDYLADLVAASIEEGPR